MTMLKLSQATREKLQQKGPMPNDNQETLETTPGTQALKELRGG